MPIANPSGVPWRRVSRRLVVLGMFLARMFAGALARRERQGRDETYRQQPGEFLKDVLLFHIISL